MGELFPGEEVAVPVDPARAGLARDEQAARAVQSLPPGRWRWSSPMCRPPRGSGSGAPRPCERRWRCRTEVLRTLLDRVRGYEVKTQGGAFMLAFASPVEAVRWCLEAQEALLQAPWSRRSSSPSPRQRRSGGRWGCCTGAARAHGRARGRAGVPRRRAHGPCGLRRPDGEHGGAGGGGGPRRPGAGERQRPGPRWRAQAEAAGPARRASTGHVPAARASTARALVEVLPTSLSDRRFGAPRRPGSGRATCPPCRRISSAGAPSWRRCGAGSRRAPGSSPCWGPGAWARRGSPPHFGGLELESCAWEGGVWLCELAEARTDGRALPRRVPGARACRCTREREAGAIRWSGWALR